jgi:hypothetical protein
MNKFFKSKKAQEEMVGFALILIIVSVIILVFFSLSMKNKGVVEENYVTDNFLQAILPYTTNCSIGGYYADIDKLIKRCSSEGSKLCENDPNRNYCEALNETLEELVELSWPVYSNEDGESYYKGYDFKIWDYSDEENPNLLTNITKGNETNSYKGSQQNVEHMNIIFTVYV